ncbi:MAG: hypothetical protein ACK4YQ_18645 [Phenylobacterium sp.]|uniref:hypothetical protein n=1 Tax=Phenylobacterium sp. TaxID=1871053 RepID=UPI00391D68BD
MIVLKLEQVGDRLGLILDEEARAELHAKAGEAVHLSRSADGELAAEIVETGQDDGRHERGRAFLKRYKKNLGAL